MRQLWMLALVVGALAPARATAHDGPAVRSGNLVQQAGQVLFTCKTDKLFDPRADQPRRRRQSTPPSRPIEGAITLALNVKTGVMTLFVRRSGEPEAIYRLVDVEQGSSPSSGVSFKADTTIRARSGDKVFTLFAAYDNADTWRDPEAEGGAALEIAGDRSMLLECGPRGYASRRVAVGPGRSTGIYMLWYDGFARKLENLPDWPND